MLKLITSSVIFYIVLSVMLKNVHSFKRLSLLRSLSVNCVPSVGHSSFAVNAIASQVTTPYKLSDALQLTVDATSSFSFQGDTLIIPLYKPKNIEDLKSHIPNQLSENIKSIISDLIDEGTFKAEIQSKIVVRLAPSSDLNIKYIAIIGLGSSVKKEEGDYEVSVASKLGKSISIVAKDTNSKSIGIVSPSIGNAGLSQLFLGLHDGVYNDNRFKKVIEGTTDKKLPLESLTIVGASQSIVNGVKLTYKLTDAIASGVNFAKDLVVSSLQFYRILQFIL